MRFSHYMIVFMTTACGVANACGRNRYQVCYNAMGAGSLYYAGNSHPCNQGYGQYCCRVSGRAFYKLLKTTSVVYADFVQDFC
ncbi:hypothetical protein MJO29_002642 [Puccinia striiformis f. sp. tritici]|nr:hypothetical protein MJO29_002642 [Puccinia striiformis f. sp. tritici]